VDGRIKSGQGDEDTAKAKPVLWPLMWNLSLGKQMADCETVA
jgi:hypothetical protein